MQMEFPEFHGNICSTADINRPKNMKSTRGCHSHNKAEIFGSFSEEAGNATRWRKPHAPIANYSKGVKVNYCIR